MALIDEKTNKTRRNFLAKHGNAGIFSASVLIHLGILFLIGGAVITEGLISKTQMTGEVVVAPAAEESAVEAMAEAGELPETESAEMPEMSGSPAPQEALPELISSTVVSQGYTMPPPSFAGTVAGTGEGMGSGSGSGKGDGPAGRAGRMLSRVKIFGTDVEASKLGAVVDVSGTATPFILPTLKEIQKNFEDAVIVLACGCALTVPKGTAKSLAQVDLNAAVIQGAGGYTAVGYIKATMEKDEKVDQLIKKLQKNPNAWLLEGNGLDVTHAIEKCVNEGVDAIYWFSDFRDGVREELAKKVAADLKSRGIKLYIHSFTGQAIPPLQQAMVDETGGKSIVVIPKK